MGYSHSWTRPRSIAPFCFNAIARDFTSLLPALELAGSPLANPDGREEPEINSNFIGFNGVANCGHTPNPDVRLPWPIVTAHGVGTNAGQGGALPHRTCNGDCSYESHWFERVQDDEQGEDRVFSATKTAFRPYDLAVTAFLVVVKHHLRSEILIESDGRACQWADALAICQEVLGYGQGFLLTNGCLEIVEVSCA